ncbi:MAG: SapB/AmfS family lanthipeptide [Pseudonocardiales bacterium]
MSLLDLQGMESDEATSGAPAGASGTSLTACSGGSSLSVSGCGGASGVSLTGC